MKVFAVVTVQRDTTSEYGYEWYTTQSLHFNPQDAAKARNDIEDDFDTCSDYIELDKVLIEEVEVQ